MLIKSLERDDTIPSGLHEGNGNIKVRSNLLDVFANGHIGSVPMGVLMSTPQHRGYGRGM